MSIEVEGVDFVRFRPSRIFGWYLSTADEVTISPKRIRIGSDGIFNSFFWRQMAWRCDSLLANMCRVLDDQRLLMVGERSYCRTPSHAYFIFHHRTPITICMPTDDTRDYVNCYFAKIQRVLAKGGFGTYDLN